MTVLEENSPSNPSQWPGYATSALKKVIVILFIKLIIKSDKYQYLFK